jgi:hypothetical protein
MSTTLTRPDKRADKAVRAEAERVAIQRVIERLERRFPTVDRDEVHLIVHVHLDRFAHSRIRDFVPILVERAARDSLATRATT